MTRWDVASTRPTTEPTTAKSLNPKSTTMMALPIVALPMVEVVGRNMSSVRGPLPMKATRVERCRRFHRYLPRGQELGEHVQLLLAQCGELRLQRGRQHGVLSQGVGEPRCTGSLCLRGGLRGAAHLRRFLLLVSENPVPTRRVLPAVAEAALGAGLEARVRGAREGIRGGGARKLSDFAACRRRGSRSRRIGRSSGRRRGRGRGRGRGRSRAR
mmetsp:Transcript_51308/g.164815  ORF Transcript_51308/g.164815 Transcript_51308/m.164815 type:complete len:214 (-) Transcript_51308:169-810(-)